MLSDVVLGWDEYYMDIARAVSRRSSCSRRQVGAIMVVDRGIVSTGYNGTPFGFRNCNEGGCPRCASDVPSHNGYDTCLCVHAEENSIALAARRGVQIAQATLYTTLRPCIHCLRFLVQAGIVAIRYEEKVRFDQEIEDLYSDILRYSSIEMVQLESR